MANEYDLDEVAQKGKTDTPKTIEHIFKLYDRNGYPPDDLSVGLTYIFSHLSGLVLSFYVSLCETQGKDIARDWLNWMLHDLSSFATASGHNSIDISIVEKEEE